MSGKYPCPIASRDRGRLVVTALRSLRFDARGWILDYTDSGSNGYQVRLILNYELDLL